MELRDTDAQYTEDLDKLCDFSGPNAIDACLEGGKLPSVTPASWRLLTRPFVIVASWFFGIEVLRREQLKRKHEPLEGRGRGRSRGTGKGRGRGRAKLERALSKEEEDEIIPPSQKDFVPAKAKARVRAPKPKPNQTEPTTAAKARAAKAKAKAKAKGKPSGSKSKAAGPTTPEKSKRTKKVKVRMTPTPSRTPVKSFARRVRPKQELPRLRWTAIRGAFNELIRPKLKQRPSSHEDF